MSQREIGATIGFSQSTVSKELARNRGKRGYRPKQAHELARKRKEAKRTRGRKMEGQRRWVVEQRLREKHSPEQISGALAKEGVGISHETIYRHIARDKAAGGDLHKNLRINGKRRYRRRVKAGRVGKIPNRRGIEERPASVEARRYYGDWEVDLIDGGREGGYLLSLYERKSRTGRLARLATKSAEETARAIIKELKSSNVRTLTFDNGTEFSRHEEVGRELGATTWFCAPYHSWEKGGVENYNGLVRQYFPKGGSLKHLGEEEVKRVEQAINDRPRKTLNFKCPSDYEHKLAS